jgi:hypothetical protein
MQKLSPIRFGVALGIAGSVFYLACMVFMATAPSDAVTWFSNSLLHGVDIKSIMRESVPVLQSLVGIASTFVGGWIFGWLTATIYNIRLGDNRG